MWEGVCNYSNTGGQAESHCNALTGTCQDEFNARASKSGDQDEDAEGEGTDYVKSARARDVCQRSSEKQAAATGKTFGNTT